MIAKRTSGALARKVRQAASHLAMSDSETAHVTPENENAGSNPAFCIKPCNPQPGGGGGAPTPPTGVDKLSNPMRSIFERFAAASMLASSLYGIVSSASSLYSG